MTATRPGSAWLVPVLTDLWERGPLALVADDAGHTRTVTTDLETRGVPVRRLTGSEYATATASFIGRAEDGTLCHDDATELAGALQVSTLRALAGGRAFDERTSAGPIDHLKAATVAAFVAQHQPAVIPIY